MSDFIPTGGYERVPAREFMVALYGKPDDYVVRTADGLQRWTVGELRALARKGQAIDVPRASARPALWGIDP